MAHTYDMVSGEWRQEGGDSLELTSTYACPAMRLESVETLLSVQAETVTRYRQLPPDLASVSVTHFLKSQAAQR